MGGQKQVKRVLKDFDEKRCIQTFKNTVWEDILLETNVDIDNSNIVDSEAPIKTVQMRAKYKNWISPETKSEMLLRDRAREKAKESDKEED